MWLEMDDSQAEKLQRAIDILGSVQSGSFNQRQSNSQSEQLPPQDTTILDNQPSQRG